MFYTISTNKTYVYITLIYTLLLVCFEYFRGSRYWVFTLFWKGNCFLLLLCGYLRWMDECFSCDAPFELASDVHTWLFIRFHPLSHCKLRSMCTFQVSDISVSRRMGVSSITYSYYASMNSKWFNYVTHLLSCFPICGIYHNHVVKRNSR